MGTTKPSDEHREDWQEEVERQRQGDAAPAGGRPEEPETLREAISEAIETEPELAWERKIKERIEERKD